MKRVFLVEDNLAFAAMIRKTLTETEDVQVEAVHDGRAAIERLRKAAAEGEGSIADLVLLDLELPYASGFDVLSAIRAMDSLRGLPVVILTHRDDEEDIQRAYALGANNYVVKTKNLSEAVRRIQDYWLAFSRIPGNS